MRKKSKIKRQNNICRIIFFVFIILVLLSGMIFPVFAGKENTVSGYSRYTVEFKYEKNEYVIAGGSDVLLSEISENLGLYGGIQSWTVSDTDLFDVFSDDGIPRFLSLKPFDSIEWLKVVIDGIEYEITVTDDNTTQNVPSDGFYTGTVTTPLDDNVSMTGYDYYVNAVKPTNIRQSTGTDSATDFAAGLSLSTIFIDSSKIGGYGREAGAPNPAGLFTLLTTDENIAGGFILDGETVFDSEGVPVTKPGFDVRYDPTRSPALLQASPNAITELNGPLFQFVFSDAAVLPDGSRADLRITYSNAKIAVDQRLGVTDEELGLESSNYQGSIKLAHGSSFSRAGSDLRWIGLNKKNEKPALATDGGYTLAQREKMAEAVKDVNDSYSTSPWSATSLPGSPVIGHTMDATYQIVDKSGNPINGTFIFAMAGINLDRDPYSYGGNNSDKALWYYDNLKLNPVLDDENNPVDADEDGNPDYEIYGKNFNFFSESVAIKNGMVSDYVYVRPNTGLREDNKTTNPVQNTDQAHFYPLIIKDENGNIKFIANGYQDPADAVPQLTASGNNLTYSSGFVLMGDAFEGITITSAGHGWGLDTNIYGGGMDTQLFIAKQIWYRYVSVTGPHGNIQTTSEGNFGGGLNDTSDTGTQSKILDPGAYVVPEGKTVTYKLIPEDKYQISKLQVKNSNGRMQEIKFNGKPLYTMLPGQTCDFRDAANNLCTLTALENGNFTLKMPYALHDEEVHVEWERPLSDVTVVKNTVDNKSGTFNFKIRAWKKEDVTIYNTGTSWEDDAIGSIWVESENYFTNCSGIDADTLAAIVSGITLTERIEIYGGSYLWKTDKKLSDLGLASLEDDDDLFIDFLNAPSAIIGDTLNNVLNINNERIYFYNPHTTVDNVTTYWNFDEEKGQSSPVAEHSFSLEVPGDTGITFNIPKNYQYEVYEETTGWELLSIDGVNGADIAVGLLTDKNSSCEHTFLNRKLQSLSINKQTVDDEISDTFHFTVKITAPAAAEQNYTVSAVLTVSEGVPSYSFENTDGPFSVNGIIVPAGSFDYGENTYLDGICNIFLGLSASSPEQQVTLGTQSGKVSTDTAQSLLFSEESGVDGTYSATYTFHAPGMDAHPYIFSPAGAAYDAGNGYYTFSLPSGETFTFDNIPLGCEYEVNEVDIPEDWVLVETTDESGTLDTDKTAVFVNEKQGVFIPETGIYTDSIPYVVVLGFVIIFLTVAAFRFKRKVSIDD